MISANEEMQSTNEEMQSVNEELDTINSEYQHKNKELLDINDDLNNYFRSNINGQLFINNELILMKFSPGTVKQFNFLDTDIGRPLSNITTNIKFETIIDDIKQVIKDGNIITKEIETNNGKWYQVMTMPYFRQSEQKNNGAIITFNDISELRKVQRELNVSNRTLAMAIDAAEMGTYAIDIPSGTFVPSDRLKEIFGFNTSAEMSFENAVSKIGAKYRVLFTKSVENSLTNGAKMDIEFPIFISVDHKPIWVRAIGNVVYDKDKPVYFAGVVNDVTVHKEDEFRKNDFIGMANHELKSPLTTLQAYVQLIGAKAKSSGDDFLIRSIEKVNIQLKRMNNLINGFLNTSSFESGKIYLHTTSFEINELLAEMIDEAKFVLTKHSIFLLTHAKFYIAADRDKIGQVFNNLIGNAVKYAPEGTQIELSVEVTKEMVTIKVKDQGVGVHLKDQKKLFERYYRVSDSQTKKISGFGLGLYLSAEIIRLHKGQIWVKSERGEGSTFCFSLPVVLK